MTISPNMLRKKILFTIITVTVFAVAGFLLPARASESNGTIDSTNKYVWASKIGWINFNATNSSIAITDTAITGYAWNEQYGWINMSPTNSGVSNDAEGNLSGSAWGENTGWVDFSSVIINSSGVFTGTATGDNVGTINFDCTNCSVTTDWRPESTRATDDSSGGGTFSSGGSVPVMYSVSINNGEEQTNDLSVKVYFKGDTETKYVWLGEKSSLLDATRHEYSPTNGQYVLSYLLSGGEGIKTVYSKFCNSGGHCGAIVSDSIIYSTKIEKDEVDKKDTTKKDEVDVIEDKKDSDQTTPKQEIGKVIQDTVKDILTKIDLLIPDSLKIWKAKEKEKVEDIRKYVATTTPLAMFGRWELLPKEPIKDYVFAPLPDEFKALASKFPSIGNLFKTTNISTAKDLRKLVDTRISIPSLGKAIGLPSSFLSVENISKDQKAKLPTEMVFSQGAGQLIDFSTFLSLSSDGLPQQKLKTISGKKIHLSIKPEYPAKSIKGYLTFKSMQVTTNVSKKKFAYLSDYIKLAQPVRASYDNSELKNVDIEERMVITSFEYTDDDKDGIYTAEVYSPIPAGSYEILTVIDYIDDKRGNKIIKLITVVDPEGYVYEKIKGKELRISNALVALYSLNSKTKKFELWNADKYQQKNSQITDVRGSYAFLVPAGTYYLKAVAPGYEDHTSAIFKVTEGNGVHMNIELKSRSWWVKSWDFKTWVIILMGLIVLYLLEKEIKRKITKKEK